MKRKLIFSLVIGGLGWLAPANAQQVNDNNTPLHLMQPAYQVGYGVPSAEGVKQTIDRVLRYIDAETPAMLVDKLTRQEVTRLQDIDANTQLKQGGFRLTSYEWGVTYSAVLAAYEATGDPAYRDYVVRRHQLLADIAPVFQKVYVNNKDIDRNIRRVIDPHALDDAGAVCCSMIKAMLNEALFTLHLHHSSTTTSTTSGTRNIVSAMAPSHACVRIRTRYGSTTCLWAYRPWPTWAG